jgi:hypothetical protein
VQNFNSPNYVRFIIFVKPKKVFRFEILYVGIVRHYLHLGFSCRIMWKYEFYIFQKKGLHIACVLKRILKKKSPMTALCCSSGCSKRISSMKKLGDDILYRKDELSSFFLFQKLALSPFPCYWRILHRFVGLHMHRRHIDWASKQISSFVIVAMIF